MPGFGYGFGFRRSRGASSAPTPIWAVDFSAVTPGPYAAASLLALGSGGLILTRASVATIQTSATTIDSTPGVDIPRVCFRGVTARGLLLEESRTNSLLRSRDITHASWSGPDGGVTVTGDAATGPDGSVLADQINTGGVANKYGKYQSVTVVPVWKSCSTWARQVSGTGTFQFYMGNGGASDFAFADAASTTTWKRYTITANTGAGGPAFMSQDGRDYSTKGGVAAVAINCYSDLRQVEAGRFATSSIITAGSTVTRAGERLRHATPANLLSSGRLGLLLTIYPLGASDEYLANMRLWTIDASNYAEVNFSTRVVTVVIGGVTRTLGALPTWTREQKLEIWLAAGGGALTTVGKARVNGGSVTDLGSGAAQASIAPGANPIELLCAGTASQLSSMIESVAAYPSGVTPAWAA